MNKKMDDYYLILEVHMLAGSEAIKNSYRRLCKVHHPDNGGSIEHLNKINEAYEVLIDDEKRKEYHLKWKKSFLSNEKNSDVFNENDLYSNVFRPLKKVVNEYMFLIKNKDYELAYTLLSVQNKNKIFKKDFIIWQKLIGEIYILIDYNCVLDDFGKDVTMRVKVTELNLLVNRVEEDVFLRKLIYENNEWKILLNDIDVKSIIRKYKRIIAINKKNRKMIQKNFLSLNEKFDSRYVSSDIFFNNCEYEFFRFERYERMFCVLKIQLMNQVSSLERETIIERMLEQNTRKTDSYTKIDDSTYLVLLPETTESSCISVKNKILKILDSSYIDVIPIEKKYKSVKEYIDIFTNK